MQWQGAPTHQTSKFTLLHLWLYLWVIPATQRALQADWTVAGIVMIELTNESAEALHHLVSHWSIPNIYRTVKRPAKHDLQGRRLCSGRELRLTCEAVVGQVHPTFQADTLSSIVAFVMAATVISPGAEGGTRWPIVILLTDCSVAHVHSYVAIDTSVRLSCSEGLADGKV